ncbi:sensor histidine kinase [Streptomyces aidingensis]|uniref:histidine kinase n=1 Tax=Streptomyces aidingensis TaxID=910347 RepID=A0A1I1MVK6_9ACTN|nr:sensor histidine kinase [Streptomyces aidingensis]SFC89477.1 Signal transduction histidine kinase [Streptomyces aidingensis]
MTDRETEDTGEPGRAGRPARRRGAVRLRTLLIWLAVVPSVAMGAQLAFTAERWLQQAEDLRADVTAGERVGLPLYELMTELQAERSMTAARWSGFPVEEADMAIQRSATDWAATTVADALATGPVVPERTAGYLADLQSRLEELDAFRETADNRSGSASHTVGYYTRVIAQIIRIYQEFASLNDAGLTSESRPVTALLSADELLAREDATLALGGPAGVLNAAQFSDFTHSVGAQRYLMDTSVIPYLTPESRRALERITASDAWKSKIRTENAVLAYHGAAGYSITLPEEAEDWAAAEEQFSAELSAFIVDRMQEVLDKGKARAGELETEVGWLVAGSAAALLLVIGAVVLTTRSVLRRLAALHGRTVTVADRTLPAVVERLQQGRPVAEDELPRPTGEKDEVGRISDAFARVVAVSVDGHRQLADERHGFGSFAAGIASRTGNLVSRQLTLTEELQDTFGSNEALLAQLMRSDQLTVGMRRQIENLLILAGGEIPDPHIEPMRVADLLREAAAEVEDFRRIERQALDEISVQPRVISQISHLLAELLDNATRFSPPRSKVVIRAELVADGLSVEVEDRGPRVAAERYEEMNGRLRSAPPYSVLAENAHRLGLFVVGHLAARLGARVTLRRSVYGGTSAVVILPAEHLVPAADPAPAPQGAARAERPDTPEQSGTTGRSAKAGQGERAEPAGTTEQTGRTRQGQPAEGAAEDAGRDTGRAPVPGPRPAPPSEGPPTAAGLPRRRPGERAREVTESLARPDGARPPLPERVPQTHMAGQLLNARAPESAARDDATPEEVADAWDDYALGTQTVEEELRRDRA